MLDVYIYGYVGASVNVLTLCLICFVTVVIYLFRAFTFTSRNLTSFKLGSTYKGTKFYLTVHKHVHQNGDIHSCDIAENAL